MAKRPILIDLEDGPAPPPVSEAPPVPEPGKGPAPDGHAMQIAARVASRRPSKLSRFFWASALALLGAMITTAAWDAINGWIARAPILGWILAALTGLFLLALLLVALRELATLGRLRKVDQIRHDVNEAIERKDLGLARKVTDRIVELYERRDDTKWGRERLDALEHDQLDADGLLRLTERELLAPLDRAAEREVETAARQVATITALVPLALADVVAALTANLRMIRRIAETYGGRTGWLGGWRLTRAVMTHLVATGAVAVGDDMLEPVLGGSILGRLSRRFGEGLVNGALTARVGVAAMEVCRPMPFHHTAQPKASSLVRQALTGLVSKSDR